MKTADRWRVQSGEAGPDRCENCHSHPVFSTIDSLLRLQNVATKSVIESIPMEEVTPDGYELRTGLRFKEVGGLAYYQVVEVSGSSSSICTLTYGDAATIWAN